MKYDFDKEIKLKSFKIKISVRNQYFTSYGRYVMRTKDQVLRANILGIQVTDFPYYSSFTEYIKHNPKEVQEFLKTINHERKILLV